MIFHGAHLAFEKEPDRARIDALGQRTWELADFIVNGLGVTTWPGSFPRKIAFHRSCHSRGTNSGEAAMTLLGSIEGLEVLPFGEAEQCCGFGGAFSVSYPNISAAMGRLKLDHVRASHPDVLVSGDMGCLLHLGGMVDRQAEEARKHPQERGGSAASAPQSAATTAAVEAEASEGTPGIDPARPLPRLHLAQVLRDALSGTPSV
jgi:L-lactate dehydrogenase complex protein LldE